VIPLSVLDYEDQGRSTPAAEVMVSEPREQMVAAWTGSRLTGAPSPAAAALLQRNMAAAAAIRLRGTPTFIWRKADGSAGRSDGLPNDLNAVIASIGH
jgi:thiol:disulfide interchange protein DsbG